MSPIGDAIAALKKAADGNSVKRNLKDIVDNVSSCLVLLVRVFVSYEHGNLNRAELLSAITLGHGKATIGF